jgi:aspartate dehydrogenase
MKGAIAVGIAGLGAIGRAIARKLANGEVPGVALGCVAVRDAGKAQAFLDGIGSKAPIYGIERLARASDLVIECAPAAAFAEIAVPVLTAGTTFMAISAGQLLEPPDLVALAKENGAQIIVPTGALIGLDAVTAAAEGEIRSVNMITRKPVKGLLGAPYLEKRGISIAGITEPLRIFEGSAREAARGFPENVNVVAALALAGIGPDRTKIEIWADPSLARNVHRVVVDSDSASFEMSIQNIPSENPKTGRITALSILAALRKLRAPLRVGT